MLHPYTMYTNIHFGTTDSKGNIGYIIENFQFFSYLQSAFFFLCINNLLIYLDIYAVIRLSFRVGGKIFKVAGSQ